MDLFDWKKYIEVYEDLKLSNINSRELAFEHWVNYGQKEGRKFFALDTLYTDSNYNDFDWKKYIDQHEDLKNANLRSRSDALAHWINYGKYEKRIYFKKDPAKKINLIGIVDIKCSISDNLNMIKNYFTTLYDSVNVINYTSVDNLIVDESEDYLICLQPFEIIKIISFLKNFNNRPAVFWVWEFKYLPKIFYDQQHLFSKIYVPSNFCKEIFTSSLNLNVEKIVLKLKILDVKDTISNHVISDAYVNSILEINKNKIKLGYCFDINSSLIRKNVFNLVKAFNNFCKNNDNNDVILILKYRLPRSGIFDSRHEKLLYNKIMGYIDNNYIYGINVELSDMDLYRLYTYFDYYISPHMGEGYGLTIEENLVLGNKIISTYYSGEKDFLTETNFYKLDHEEIQVTDLKTHVIYRLLPNYTAAYVSDLSILNTLNKIFDKKSKTV